MFNRDSAFRLLDDAKVFFGGEELSQVLNMNDIWCWASSDSEHVSDEELPEVAELFFRHGWAGILYWVSKKRNRCRSEFYDNNRLIEFVEHEERIREEFPDSNKRAYHQVSYTITGERGTCSIGAV